ncbi:hypothetical protein [Prolixibacter sp. SD074]|uniref:hypothetical protein n=1 Tax=Prolixibacter sp. SD074 TaxID=2652391 RepID=UPI001270D1F5|nr:hypothetical protein [Prolixibacter sp. SD074]GET30047.1 hypothetical protein SD074_22490 [Prolixibacter sp. SD074]
MAKNDSIKVKFTDEQLDAMKQGLQQVFSVINPIAPVLSSDDRRNYGSVADQNKLLINRSKSYMEQFPKLKPAFVNKAEFHRDFAALKEIGDLLILLSDMQRKLTYMKILLDHGNYQDALAFYRSVRYNPQEKEASAIPIYNDLKKYFPSGGAKTDGEGPNPSGPEPKFWLKDLIF